MSSRTELAARKELLLARSTLYRLRLQQDALVLREAVTAPARGLALVKYLPIALIAIRLVIGKRAAVWPSLVELGGLLAGWLLASRAKPEGPPPG